MVLIITYIAEQISKPVEVCKVEDNLTLQKNDTLQDIAQHEVAQQEIEQRVKKNNHLLFV